MLTIEKVSQIVKGKILRGKSGSSVRGFSIDTRTLKSGNAYIAIKGKSKNGHDFLHRALDKGANLCVISQKKSIPSKGNILLVKDTTIALGLIAAYHRAQFQIPLIAITGSAGKTSTKEMIAAVLQSKYCVLKNERTENNQFGVPLTLLKLKRKHQVAVIEIGTNQPGDIRWLAKVVRPTIVVYTNIGESHLEKLSSQKGVFREKMDLLKECDPLGVVIYNNDDINLRQIKTISSLSKQTSYGIDRKADVRASEIKFKGRKLFFMVGKQKFQMNASGYHDLYNALAAICCGVWLKVGYNNININLKGVKGFVQRQKYQKVGSFHLIDDSYNANPVSFRSAIRTLEAFPVRGRKLLICADMLELGRSTKSLHQQMGELIAASGINMVIGFGKYTKFLVERIKRTNSILPAHHCRNVQQVHRQLKELCLPGDIFLVKGSRSMAMEKTVHFIKTELFLGDRKTN